MWKTKKKSNIDKTKKKSNCDKTIKQNLNCGKTQELKLWQNFKKKQIVTKLERSNCNQTQKLKLCKTKKINCDDSKTQIVIVI